MLSSIVLVGYVVLVLQPGDLSSIARTRQQVLNVRSPSQSVSTDLITKL
jgi:hypothetical protein